VRAVMVSHGGFPNIDIHRGIAGGRLVPASINPSIVRDLLRDELGYEGLVVTDDLEMGAIAKHWPIAEAAVLAVQAGCDVLPVSNSHDAQVAAIEAVVRAVESEAVSWASLDDAQARIRRLKERFVLPYRDPDPKQARLAAGAGQRQGLTDAIALRSGG